mmetsp:Transcript_16943/g.35629  ORF Transcript_16943/g.35629 Transcript_16943/m.35629 type:complete len:215 (+) Transcript_16943:124-768(+)
MVQRRGRPLKGFGDGSSSSESDEDAFASISKKKKPRLNSFGGGGRGNNKPQLSTNSNGTTDTVKHAEGGGDASSSLSANNSTPVVAADTSSNKRHHHVNAARQAKMDALLQELQTTKPSDPATARGEDYGSIQDGDSFYGRGEFAPHKKGSYVEPGMEHLTTNLFVGNLDPMTTEEELTDAFRQFGKDIFRWLFGYDVQISSKCFVFAVLLLEG